MKKILSVIMLSLSLFVAGQFAVDNSASADPRVYIGKDYVDVASIHWGGNTYLVATYHIVYDWGPMAGQAVQYDEYWFYNKNNKWYYHVRNNRTGWSNETWPVEPESTANHVLYIALQYINHAT